MSICKRNCRAAGRSGQLVHDALKSLNEELQQEQHNRQGQHSTAQHSTKAAGSGPCDSAAQGQKSSAEDGEATQLQEDQQSETESDNSGESSSR